MQTRLLLGGLTALLTLASAASAQVKYKLYPIGGSAQATPVDLPNGGGIIDVGTLDQNKELHVYDDSGVDDNLGQIIVRGTSSGFTLRVKVVSAQDTDTFVQQADQPLVFGLRNFGGIRFEHPTDPNDTSLRDHAVVAVAVQGDIAGDIEAGQIWRIDALQSSDGSFGGRGGITRFPCHHSPCFEGE